jgi:XTP/dITP diphosphohydrolase
VIVFATRNRGKLRELEALVGEPVKSLLDFGDVEVVEDAESFEGNAEKKARAAFELTGMPSVGDDSGLEVLALGNAPGVRSARYAGEHDDAANREKLLREMRDIEDRRARFRCVLVYLGELAVPARMPVKIVAEGECRGEILRAPRGENGFGYDPLFLVEGTGRSMAELAMEEKNRLSHRAKAFAKLVQQLRA